MINERTAFFVTPGAVAVGVCLVLAGAGIGRPTSLIPPAGQPVTFYILRFELETTAEKFAVTFQDISPILTAHSLGPIEKTVTRGASLRGVWLRQELPGSRARTEAEYAVSPTAAGRTLPLVLGKKGRGEGVLAVFARTRGGEIPLLKTTLTEDSGRTGLDLSLLASIPPVLEFDDGRPGKMVWAFYYLWYDSLRAWKSRILLDRPAVPYVSQDPFAIARHVQEARGAGIDGFIASWWGPRSASDENLARLLDIARLWDFRVMINFELIAGTDAEGQPIVRSEEEIYDWLREAIDRHGPHPAYMKLEGGPVFVIWSSPLVPVPVWARILSRLKDEGRSASLIAEYGGEWPDLDVLETFDGLHTYNILNLIHHPAQVAPVLAPAYERTGRGVRYFRWLSELNKPRLWTATVEPGYDDHLQGKTSPILPRDDGALYRATFEAAARSDPDWIFITTWNEWWEHTYIEPSELYGDAYLKLTAGLTALWKSGGFRSFPEQKNETQAGSRKIQATMTSRGE